MAGYFGFSMSNNACSVEDVGVIIGDWFTSDKTGKKKK